MIDAGTATGSARAASRTSASHNLLGQRLGRKGRDTRQRILDALAQNMARDDGTPVSLSAVAREASVAMTTLYLYFGDLGELVLAALKPVIEDGRGLQVRLRHRWPDEELAQSCQAYLREHQDFWQRHARLLHLRNGFADAGDRRFLRARIDMARPQIRGLIRQMDGDPTIVDSPSFHMAVVVMTGIERAATTVTGPFYAIALEEAAIGESDVLSAQLAAAARMLELAIRDRRTIACDPGTVAH